MSSSSLVTQMVKSLPKVQKTWAQSTGWEDPLEKEMATHSNILAWKIPWMVEPGRLQSDTTEQLHFTQTMVEVMKLIVTSLIVIILC